MDCRGGADAAHAAGNSGRGDGMGRMVAVAAGESGSRASSRRKIRRPGSAGSGSRRPRKVGEVYGPRLSRRTRPASSGAVPSAIFFLPCLRWDFCWPSRCSCSACWSAAARQDTRDETRLPGVDLRRFRAHAVAGHGVGGTGAPARAAAGARSAGASGGTFLAGAGGYAVEED